MTAAAVMRVRRIRWPGAAVLLMLTALWGGSAPAQEPCDTPESLRRQQMEDYAPIRFDVVGTEARMTGTLGPSAPCRLVELVDGNAAVRRIVMVDVPGAVDEDAVLAAGRLLRVLGLATHVPADGVIAAGAVTFFLGGRTRSAAIGARFGIRSWRGRDPQTGAPRIGAALPPTDPAHRPYLNYFRALQVPEAFYWDSLRAAPPTGMAWFGAEAAWQRGLLCAPPRR